MGSQELIYSKLELFIRKFYLNELLRGSLCFIGLGLIYLFVTVFVEYFLWLPRWGRSILFWSFIIVEVFLLFRFVIFPVSQLLKLKDGIDYEGASIIIGKHFAEVSDKLTNFLQLANEKNELVHSELYVAAIEQKVAELKVVPFTNAVDFSSNKKYYPLAIIPVGIFLLFFVSGNSAILSQSFGRVVQFNKAFSPPAPFVIGNDNLVVQEGKDFILRVETKGKVVPENIMVQVNDESYFMEALGGNTFQYKFSKVSQNLDFKLVSNDVVSDDFELEVVAVPAIQMFEMSLQFPSYLKRKDETIKGSGNAVIPEGTMVTWHVRTQATGKIVFFDGNQSLLFKKSDNNYSIAKKIVQNTQYQIITSNSRFKNYEKLGYQLNVVKDAFPNIVVSHAPDSLKVARSFVIGQIADDYGISKLQIVYYRKDNPSNAKRGTLPIKGGVVDKFVFSFPSNLPIEKGTTYDYYFEVFDNDVLHNFKSSKSSVFSSRIESKEEAEDNFMMEQNQSIDGLQKSLKNQEKQLTDIDKLQKIGKEKDLLDFKDQMKVADFVKKQVKQDQVIKDFVQKLENNLDKFKSDKNDAKKEELQKRLERAEKELEKNEKLLDELKQLNDKIQNEDLLTKLDKFKQNSKNQVKNLEQLVELTKRYYVEKKAEKFSERLNELGDKQLKNAESRDGDQIEKQEEINKDFDKLKEDLKELKKENKDLKNPVAIPDDVKKEKSIDDDLQKSVDDLKTGKKEKASSSQKSASKKMKELGNKMKMDMDAAAGYQLEEDVEVLRQVLDNLLAFSLSQEDLLKQFKSLRSGSPNFNKLIKKQQDLKQQFKHVDDSLFAMSLRNAKIEENVTKEIGNVYYNIDNAIFRLTESQIAKGISHQQFTVASANKLADFLSNILNNMQNQMSGSSGGKPKPGDGDGMQLPDIIQKQESLSQKIKKGMQGQSGKEGSKPGTSGNGQSGKEGQSGEGDAKVIMEIYREQQLLREALEKELNKQGLSSKGSAALEQMKQLEKQLLNKGFKNESLQRVLNIQQELLKLKSAVQEQGQDTKRQAEGNKKEYLNTSNALPQRLLDYLNSIEILNRQSLPLRSNFNQKVQEYFNKK